MIEPSRLVEGRELAGLLQGELADILGIKQGTLSSYETGPHGHRVRNMPQHLHVAWTDAVGRSLDYLHGRLDVFRQVSTSARKPKLVECKPSIRAGDSIGGEVINKRAPVPGGVTILVTTPPTSKRAEDQF